MDRIIKQLLAFLFVLLAACFAAPSADAIGLEYRVGGSQLGTIDHAEQNDLGTRNLCRENGWLNYDTLSGCAVATNSATRTVANTTRGWKVGDPINNLTSAGNVPKWNTVRQRYWKNEALNNGSTYSPTNVERMQRGLAPQRVNPNTGKLESMELHHTPPQRDGGLFDVEPVWPADHAAIDPFRNL